MQIELDLTPEKYDICNSSVNVIFVSCTFTYKFIPLYLGTLSGMADHSDAQRDHRDTVLNISYIFIAVRDH